MGGSESKEISQKVVNEVLTKMVTNIIINHSTDISTEVRNINNINVTNDIGGRIDCKEFEASAHIGADIKIINNVDNKVATNIINDIKQQLDNKVSQTAKLLQNEIETLIRSLTGGKSNTKISQEIYNKAVALIENNIKVENITNIKTNVDNQNNINFINKGILTGDICKLTADIALKLDASNAVSNATKAIIDNKAINDLINEAEQEAEETSALAQILKYVAIIIGLVIILKLVMGSSGGGGNGGNKLKQILILILVLVVVYLVIAYNKKIFPFEQKEKFNGMNQYGEMVYLPEDIPYNLTLGYCGESVYSY